MDSEFDFMDSEFDFMDSSAYFELVLERRR